MLVNEVARWASSTTAEQFGDRGRQAGVRAALDTLGVLVAGGGTDVARSASAALPAAPGPAMDVVTGRTRDPVSAAFVNGVAAHVLDYDDSAVGELIGHPSAVVWPAVWAVGSVRGSSAEDLLLGYVTGVEATMRLASAFGGGGRAYSRGFHTTTILGTLGAALGASRLSGFDAVRTAAAVSLATTMISGIRSSFGSPGKSLQVGHAASVAVQAVLFAEKGLHGTESALNGNYGIAAVYWGDTGEPEVHIDRFLDPYPADAATGEGPTGEVGQPLIVAPGVRTKPYAACRGTHRSIEGAINIRNRHGVSPNDIELIELTPSPEHQDFLCDLDPQNGLQAKFSIPYSVSAALLEGRAGIAQYTDAAVGSTAVRALLQKVRLVPNDAAPTWREPFAPDKITVRTKDGTRFTEAVPLELGHPRRPLTNEQLREKFKECVRFRNPELSVETDEAAADAILGDGVPLDFTGAVQRSIASEHRSKGSKSAAVDRPRPEPHHQLGVTVEPVGFLHQTSGSSAERPFAPGS